MTQNAPTSQMEWLDRVIIRVATAVDLPGMEWQGEFAHFRRVYADAYKRQLSGYSIIWVADMPGEGIIGQVFIQFICDRPELADGKKRAYLYSFRVKLVYRGMGLGTKVMEVVENDLLARGFHIVTLNVAKDNVGAQRLYERRGYVRVAHEPGIWSYPDENGVWHTVEEPAWRMEKDLRPGKDKPDRL